VEPAGEDEVIRLQRSLFDPCLQSVSGSGRDLELKCALGLVLHDDRSGGQLLTMTDVADL
jgi:hypothetical protein